MQDAGRGGGPPIGTRSARPDNMNGADLNADQQTVRRALLAERLAAVATLAEELAHEVHNPLNCALLQLAVLQRRLVQPNCEAAALRPVADLVERSLRRLEVLFNDFMALRTLQGDP
jgi:signal transduction histidine kinase